MKSFLLLFFLSALFSTFAEAENIKDEYLVKYKGLESDILGVKTLGMDAFILKSFFINKPRAEIIRDFTDINVVHVKMDQEQKHKFLKTKKSFIEYIESNQVWKATGEVKPSLPEIPKEQWGLKAADALNAWIITLGSPEIIVGIIDSGVDYDHYALKNNIWTAKDGSHGWNFVDDSNNPWDDNGHGTHCAGVIAANSKEFMGIAPHVKVMALKFLDGGGSGSTDAAIAAINFGVKNGARILSNSWGGGGYSRALADAISYANKNSVLFVAAAGNEASNNDWSSSYPANYKIDNVISVGAMDINLNKAVFSNYGKRSVHIFAAGVKIYSTMPNNEGEYLSGTSMATPQVAGIAALAYSKYPEMTPAIAKKLILDSAEKVDSLKKLCTTNGMVSASKVLK